MVHTSYRERIMQSRRGASPASQPADHACAQQGECHAMFEVIAAGLDDLKGESAATRGAIAELSERMSAQETTTKNLWHQLRSVEETLRSVPAGILSAIERHEDTCAGRDYARAKLTSTTTNSSLPVAYLHSDTTQNIRTQRQADTAFGGGPPLVAGIPAYKVALYVGGGLGAAVAGAVYLLSQLGVFSR